MKRSRARLQAVAAQRRAKVEKMRADMPDRRAQVDKIRAEMPDRREQAGQLRDRVDKQREALAERRRKRGTPKKKEKDRRRWLLIPLLLILLLALVRDCSCNEVPAPAPAPEPEQPAPAAMDTDEPVAPPLKRMERIERPDFAAKPPKSPPWLTSFRMQVAARSPRLAECFVGAHRPGRLKWVTSVEATSGLVSEHSLEPMLLSDELSRRERDCVVEVLSTPSYNLEIGEERTTPSRVGLVIEF